MNEVTYEQREVNRWGEEDAAPEARHCQLCDDGSDDPSGYCTECQTALLLATAEEMKEDPDVAWHVARLLRYLASQRFRIGERGAQ